MKINFRKVKVFGSLDKEKCDIVDISSVLANAIYMQGQGIHDHTLCHKIYECKDEDIEYADDEIETIRKIVYQLSNPVMIETINNLLEGDK